MFIIYNIGPPLKLFKNNFRWLVLRDTVFTATIKGVYFQESKIVCKIDSMSLDKNVTLLF